MSERVPGDQNDPELPADLEPVANDWSERLQSTEPSDSTAAAPADDRLLRLAAEYDNFRKRTTREKSEAFDRGATAMVVRLLDVLDDVNRLVSSDPATTSYESFRTAFDVVAKKLQKELESAGLERIDPVGAEFDPTMHEAVAAVAPPSPQDDHTVKATFQVGYRFKGAVVRPARVQVYSAHGVA